MNKGFKEFLPSSWAIDHSTVVYVLIFIFFILGFSSYISLPRENFPEINSNVIFVSSVYPGNTAEDVERLITDPLEEELKGVSNLVGIKSTSQENISLITIEFDENILKENENNRILRLGMVLSENGGLIYKINKIFSKLPIIFVPGNGNFKVNFVKVETVIKKFLLNPDNLSQTENIVDLNEKFINFLVTKNKLKLYVPHILTKFILFIFTKVFKINSSFTYDGYLSLINDPNEIEIGSNE